VIAVRDVRPLPDAVGEVAVAVLFGPHRRTVAING